MMLETTAQRGATAHCRSSAAMLRSHREEGPRLAREHTSRGNSTEGQHCEAAVAQLLHLHLVLSLLILGVQPPEAKIAGHTVGLALHHLDDSEVAEELRVANPAEHLSHRPELDHGIVSLDGGDLERLTRDSHAKVGCDPSDRGEHTNAPMLKLSLAQPTDINGQGEAHGVEAVLLTNVALKGWGDRQERDGLAHLVPGALSSHGHCRGAACRELLASRAHARCKTSAAIGALGKEPWEAIAGERCLRDGTAKSNHREPAILKLLQFHLLCLGLILGQEVEAQLIIASILKCEALPALGKGCQHLDNEDEERHLHEWAGSRCPIAEDAGSVRLKDAFGVASLGPRDADNVRNNQTDPREHADAAVLQLGLTEPREELRAPHRQVQWVVDVLVTTKFRHAANEASCNLGLHRRRAANEASP
mmetsp:Transcript_109863/g.283931  ORF Transcript_109863/g.283931 Transcript_109863/m.283931 type:complete len:420 (-) Transcript_109863:398-1657(-)